jgi:hypothetical protein
VWQSFISSPAVAAAAVVAVVAADGERISRRCRICCQTMNSRVLERLLQEMQAPADLVVRARYYLSEGMGHAEKQTPLGPGSWSQVLWEKSKGDPEGASLALAVMARYYDLAGQPEVAAALIDPPTTDCYDCCIYVSAGRVTRSKTRASLGDGSSPAAVNASYASSSMAVMRARNSTDHDHDYKASMLDCMDAVRQHWCLHTEIKLE